MGILFLNCIVKNHKKIQQKNSHRKIIFYNSLYYSYCEETYKNSFANIPPDSRTIFHVKKSSLIKIHTNSATKNQNIIFRKIYYSFQKLPCANNEKLLKNTSSRAKG